VTWHGSHNDKAVVPEILKGCLKHYPRIDSRADDRFWLLAEASSSSILSIIVKFKPIL
jgi:hypothetical protein